MPSNSIIPRGTAIKTIAANIFNWQPIAATSGDDTTVAIALYYTSVRVPGDCLVTGIGYLVGSAGGTGKVIVSLHNEAGEVLAQSAPVPQEMVAVPDTFGETGTPQELLVRFHLKDVDIAEAARRAIKRKSTCR